MRKKRILITFVILIAALAASVLIYVALSRSNAPDPDNSRPSKTEDVTVDNTVPEEDRVRPGRANSNRKERDRDAPFEPGGTSAVRGYVIALENRSLPIEGIKVHLLDSDGNTIGLQYTNERGRYRFKVPPGTYGIKLVEDCLLEEFRIPPGTVTVRIAGENGNSESEHFLERLNPPQAYLICKAVYGNTENPVPGVLVTVRAGNSGFNVASYYTDSAGIAKVPLDAGEYEYRFEKSGYWSRVEWYTCTVKEGIDAYKVRQLYLTAHLRGQVSDSVTGEPLANAVVRASFVKTKTDAEGYYELDCRSGRRSFECTADNYIDLPGDRKRGILLLPGENRRDVKMKPRNSMISIEVIDANTGLFYESLFPGEKFSINLYEILPDARALNRDHPESRIGRPVAATVRCFVRPTIKGRTVYYQVAPGIYRIRVTAPGKRNFYSEIFEVAKEDQTHLEVRLLQDDVPLATVKGNLYFEDSSEIMRINTSAKIEFIGIESIPVAGEAAVLAFDLPGRSAKIAESGEYSIQLEEGCYFVEVDAGFSHIMSGTRFVTVTGGQTSLNFPIFRVDHRSTPVEFKFARIDSGAEMYAPRVRLLWHGMLFKEISLRQKSELTIKLPKGEYTVFAWSNAEQLANTPLRFDVPPPPPGCETDYETGLKFVVNLIRKTD